MSTEWFFYWAFIPLTFLITGLRHPMIALLTLCVTAFFGIMTVFYEWHVPLADFVNHWFKHEPWFAADPLGWLLYFSPYLRVIEFIVGMLDSEMLFTMEGQPFTSSGQVHPDRSTWLDCSRSAARAI